MDSLKLLISGWVRRRDSRGIRVSYQRPNKNGKGRREV